MSLKLSARLQALINILPTNWHTEYQQIWDTCCDHGHLGAGLLDQLNSKMPSAPTIHFVDIQPQIMANLNHSLDTFYSDKASNWQTHCLSTSALPLGKFEGKQLIIIAGVGGDLVSTFVSDLVEQYPDLNADFLLCPVRRIDELRSTLIELDFFCQRERLVEDKGRIYEAMLVTRLPSQVGIIEKVTPIGNQMWEDEVAGEIKKRYAQQMISYYDKVSKQLNLAKYAQSFKDAYQTVLDKEIQ